MLLRVTKVLYNENLTQLLLLMVSGTGFLCKNFFNKRQKYAFFKLDPGFLLPWW